MTEEMQKLLNERAGLYIQINTLRKEEREHRALFLQKDADIRKGLSTVGQKLSEVCDHKNEDGTEAKQKRIDFREIQLYGNTELWYFCTICGKLLQ